MTTLVDTELILEQAAQSVTTTSAQRPASAVVLTALLQAEKEAKAQKQRYNLDQLTGTWRLCFITGTQKAQQRAGKVLGTGRYVPSWIRIQLVYATNSGPEVPETPPLAVAQIQNQVQLGALHLTLTGPAKFLSPKNILAFDFTRIQVQVFNRNLYSGFIRGGATSEADFYQERVGKQAFFAYFLVRQTIIAARGRGGGLALWARV